ncbi:MAG TPA: DUF948 domain-containing protein [Acidimicrobiales bacterium]|nr:DUF948 domain-containing protein [Acidimicrobiales bacterium]
MSAVDLAAVVVTIASVSVAVLAAFALRALQRTLALLRQGLEDLQSDTVPVVAELRRSLHHVDAELDRLDDAVASIRSASGAVDAASRLAYVAFANPVIKAMALGAGTAKAARSLRQR